MIVTKCKKCGKPQSAEEFGRQALVTVEKYTDTGMSVTRHILCEEHEQILKAWLEGEAIDSLGETARCCGND